MKVNKSIQLGVIAGIPIKLHWSFFLLVIFVIYVGFENDLGTQGTLWFGAATLTLFFCVLLHEYGHALAARKFGIKTRDIVLSPIGGMARLEKLPDKPLHEFYVALAGPTVNFIIAIVLGLYIVIFLSSSFFIQVNNLQTLFNGQDFLKIIFWMNLVLCGFNLIPAFPMDGGRILRSLLAVSLGKPRSTRIAARVGKFIAILFVIAGLVIPHVFLGLIGVFVFFMASQEVRTAKLEDLLASHKIDEVYNKDLQDISPETNMKDLIDQVYRSSKKNFLVFEDGKVIGSVPELFILEAIKKKDEEKFVKDYMSDKFAFIGPERTVLDAYQMMNENGYSILSVQSNGTNLGYIDRAIIQNLVDSSPG